MPLTHTLGYIVLAYELNKMTREDRITRESANLKPLGSWKDSIVPVEILR